jgi:SAM-dependent methyltransferase
VYERQAAGWDRHRHKNLIERDWFDRFFARIVPGGPILDFGCGAGEPLAGHVLSNGFDLTGIDYSAPMLELAQERYPDAEWIHGDMREARSLLHRHFDGIFSWDGTFHLAQDDQRQLLVDIASLLNPGGALMLTVGHEEGEVLGVVEGEQVYHSSLAPDEYADRLEALGFLDIEFVAEDPDCDMHSVLLASKG